MHDVFVGVMACVVAVAASDCVPTNAVPHYHAAEHIALR